MFFTHKILRKKIKRKKERMWVNNTLNKLKIFLKNLKEAFTNLK